MQVSLREVFGVDAGKLNWGRAHMVVATFAVLPLLGVALIPSLVGGFVLPPGYWTVPLLSSAALGVASVLAVRLLKPVAFALLAAWLVQLSVAALLSRRGGQGPAGLADSFTPSDLAFGLLGWLLPFLLMAGLLRIGWGPGVSLPLGGAAGALIVTGLSVVRASIHNPEFRPALSLDVLPHVLAQAALGGLLWLGLRLTRPAPGSRVSRPFFVGAVSATLGFAALISLAVIGGNVLRAWPPREAQGALGVMAVVFPTLLYGIVLTLTFVHRIWSCIQDGHARTSPGRAVGLLLVPFFNVYWLFVVFSGFARDYNAFLTRHGLSLPSISTGPFRAHPMLALAAAVPIVGLPFSVAAFFTLVVLIHRASDAINALPESFPGQDVIGEPRGLPRTA